MTSDHRSYIAVYESTSGWKAVMMWWNPDLNGFWEPYQTGVGTYTTREEALDEARSWAELAELELKE